MHGAVLWAVLHRAAAGDIPAAVEPPGLTVEFVAQTADVRGASSPARTAPPPAPERPPPVETADTRETATPAPTPPAPDRAVPPGPASPVQMNLAGGDQDRESLLVTGDDVVPPRPDDAIHNRPPAYPAQAARQHAQGTVGLVVHVTEAGVPAWVDVAVSSGNAALDAAARDAVALWRFRPATDGGIPVPFDFAYNIRFTLGDDRRGINGQDRPRRDQGR